MLNKSLMSRCGLQEGAVRELLLVGFLMAIGLAIAATGTYLFQWLSKKDAALRYDGKTIWHCFGNLLVSFLCGPYIMLQMGWRQEQGGTLSMTNALVAAFVAFGWSFITGLLVVGGYYAIIG